MLEWKTTSARYPEEPAGIAALDPQLVCYSWMTGIDEVAQVVFVRKRTVEVQYLRATITDEQRQEFETLVEDTVRRIESGLFLPHSGIRFPRTRVPPVPSSGSASTSPIWSRPALSASRESILVCLTNLLTRYPPMPPKLNRRRALVVLSKIDEILAWEARHENERDTKFRGTGQVPVRSAGRPVLAAGEPEVVR